VGTIGLLTSRAMWRHHLAGRRARGKYQTMVLAIGDRLGVSHLAHELARNPRDGYVVVWFGIPGYASSRGKTLMVHGREIPILGDETGALAAIGRCGAHTVAVTGTERFGVQGIRKLMWQLETMDVDLVVAPGLMDVAAARLALRPVAGFPLLHVENRNIKRLSASRSLPLTSASRWLPSSEHRHFSSHLPSLSNSRAKDRSSTDPDASAWTGSPSRC
jgi:hypothetical protein